MVRMPCVPVGDLGSISDRGTKIPHAALGVAQTNKNKTAATKSTMKNKQTWSLSRTQDPAGRPSFPITRLSHPCSRGSGHTWSSCVLVLLLRRTLLPRGLCTYSSLCESSSPRCPSFLSPNLCAESASRRNPPQLSSSLCTF